ncbi:MAG TPA: spondin domain-containing protein [Burkholderiaceae bacterium]|jgi:hypothetical protein
MRMTLTHLAMACLGMALVPAAQAATVTVTFNQTAPAGGVGVAPVWLGFQDGSYNLFNVGGTASAGLTQAAEDGTSAGLTSAFGAANPTGVQGTLPGGPIFSGDTRTLTLNNVDLTGANRFLSYAAMVVISNDFFVGNATPLDLSSIANGGAITLALGGNGGVYDAGAEINDFNYSVANGAFGIGGGQTAPGQGNAENGVIHVVTGNPYTSFLGQGQVPAGFDWTPLDFNAQPAFASLTVEVSPVPEPASLALMLSGLAVVAGIARRRR